MNAEAPVSSWAALGGSLLALLAVVALILVLAWVLKRMPGSALRGHGALRIVASLPLGMRERLVVVAAGERQFLLGVTAERITLLQALEVPLPDSPGSDFARLLGRARERSEPKFGDPT